MSMIKVTKFFRQVTRNEHQIDASGKTIGRIATQIAMMLQGKNKPTYTPNSDTGDFVKVANVAKMTTTGNKMTQKMYRNYSGYPGGLRERQLKELMGKNPGEALKIAVMQMLPKNRLRKEMIKRLIIE